MSTTTDLGNLQVVFTAETAQMDKALADTEKKISKLDKEAARVAKEMETTFRRVAVAITAAFSGITYAVKSALNTMDEMGKSAQSLGMTTEAFGRLAYAAKLADVNHQELAQAV